MNALDLLELLDTFHYDLLAVPTDFPEEVSLLADKVEDIIAVIQSKIGFIEED